MPERIFLTYTNATAMPYLGSPRAHHVVVNYVDSNGVHYRLQGLPERTFEHNLGLEHFFARRVSQAEQRTGTRLSVVSKRSQNGLSAARLTDQ